MDPMTQSTQISSSQGIADGQNSAAKESKPSDSFLSSSPVSLIQSPQDKRVVLGSDKPCEGVATSLRFPSQHGSFTPSNYGSEPGPPDGQPDSPIKTSPVSERIKALEALAAKKKEPDFRSDGGFSHFRDRNYEKSPTETPKSPTETPKSPTETPKSPTETPKSPTETKKSPSEVHKFSTETSKFFTENPNFSTETPRSPTETQKAPTEVHKFSTKTSTFFTETPTFSSETPKSPNETNKSSTGTPKSPFETPQFPNETNKSPTGTPKSPFETPKSPNETNKSPTGTPKSPFETPKSPTETNKSPTGIPKSPFETPQFPTETPKSPTETSKSLTERTTPTVQKRGGSTDQESPESPFEVLGDLRQVNEFEETEEWMKAHLPPVPDYAAVDLTKTTLTSDIVTLKAKKETDIVIANAPAPFAGVPDAFMDSPAEASKLKNDSSDAQKQSCVEESEFDLSYLPTAYMWDQQEKSGAQASSKLDSGPVPPAPPAGFDSQSPHVSPPVGMDAKNNVLDDKKNMWTGDLEPPEASEADSSGDSDDTVIEDGVSVPATVPPPSSPQAVSNDPSPAAAAPNLPTDEKEIPPKSERKLMQVPTINVIETDEPNYSDEEMEMEMELEVEEDEDYEAVREQAREAPKTPEPEDSTHEPPKTRPLETEFMEGYSPPSSPVDSDAEYSPKHNIIKPLPETVHHESASKPEAQTNQAQTEKSQATSNKENDEDPFKVTKEEVDFPDNNDEWSDEAQDIMVKPCKADVAFIETSYNQSKMDEKSNTAEKEAHMEMASLSKTSFMQDDIYDRQSFDYDYDASSTLDDIDEKGLSAKERFLSDPSQINNEPLNASSPILDNFTSVNDDEAFPKLVDQQCQREYPQDPYSSFQSETLGRMNEQDFNKKMTTDIVTDNIENSNCLPAQKIGSKLQQDTKAGQQAPETTSNPESNDSDSSVSEPTDSFVEFMRECLKSRQDEAQQDDTPKNVPSEDKFCKAGLRPNRSPPTMVMDLEQEQLTITALKELGSSQEEDVASLQSKVPDHGKANPNAASIQQSSFSAVPNPSCSQSNSVFDSTYSKEVEAIDEWVAEAYHLAEHVVTAILTHLSVKDLIHWRDPKKSGVVFGLSLLMLLSLAAFSVISVASYLLLALLCVTITFRIYKSVVQAVQKSSDGHPFKTLIDKDVSIPPETFRKHVDASLSYINRALKQMSRLFLVEDLVDSLKLAVVMWLFTYVGAVFNGITILILADILLFAVPPVYEKNKTQIDQYIDLVRTQVNTTMAKLQEKLPGAVKRSKTE
ncbi:reticulon-3 isoform X3 [Trematomus bernacchii]|uniref:reticulon-3 isoform X3 n=1 Tax=Trematomus bernacchii TaxID=40690 RepID=UPI00146BFECD|nr:reticulon-3 isoform X3 [Trematomus bernacchii]